MNPAAKASSSSAGPPPSKASTTDSGIESDHGTEQDRVGPAARRVDRLHDARADALEPRFPRPVGSHAMDRS